MTKNRCLKWLFAIATAILLFPAVCTAASLEKCRIRVEAEGLVYTGEAQTPPVTVTYKGEELTEGRDYQLEYSQNTDAGTGKVKVTGLGDYKGTVRKTFSIAKAENEVKSQDITAVWSAEVQKIRIPAEAVHEAKLSWSVNNKSVRISKEGEVSVPAKFVGTIQVKITASSTTNYLKASATVSLVILPEIPQWETAVSGGKGITRLAWGACGGSTGYEVQVSENEAFEEPHSIELNKKAGTSLTLDSLEKGKTYWVRVRTLNSGKKKSYTSGWSEVRKLEVPLTVLAFGTDYQSLTGYKAAEIFDALLEEIDTLGYQPDYFIMGGDYTNANPNYGTTPKYQLTNIRRAVFKHFPLIVPKEEILFVQGNHDEWYKRFKEDGILDWGDVLVYVLNTQTGNPWNQGPDDMGEVVIESALKMQETLQGLIDAGETRPVIIATHVPLHYSRWTAANGDNAYSDYLFEVINDAAEKLDIVFLFGHNHGGWGDSSIGGTCTALLPGSSIMIPYGGDLDEDFGSPDFGERTLNFTYMCYGYVGYITKEKGAVETANTMGMMIVYPDRIELQRVDSNGLHVLGAKGKKIFDALPDDYLSQEIPSPYSYPRKNAE